MPDNIMDNSLLALERDIDLIFESQCLLFIGSGFSIGAKNVDGNFIPTASELKTILEKQTGLEATDLGQAAEDFISINGE